MQRILSVETSRNPNTSSEFVSKRLCFSVLFSIAFLFLLAGYLLGRYTTDKAILLRKTYMQQKLSLDEKNPIDIIKNISATIKSINNSSFNTLTGPLNATDIYEKLKCPVAMPTFREFEKDTSDVNLKISRMVTAHLESLERCFNNIDDLLINKSVADSD